MEQINKFKMQTSSKIHKWLKTYIYIQVYLFKNK